MRMLSSYISCKRFWPFIHRESERNCPKSCGRSCYVALRDTKMVLVGPFWPSYTAQIYGRSVAPTPFRTVSLGSPACGRRGPGLRSRLSLCKKLLFTTATGLLVFILLLACPSSLEKQSKGA